MIMTRRSTFGALGLVGLTMFSGVAVADWRDEVPMFRIGILGGALGAEQLADYQCWKRMVQKGLGVPVELSASFDYAETIAGLLDGSLHAAQLGAAGYAATYLQDPDAIEPVVAPKQADGTLGHYSVMLVRADSPFESLDDLRGRSLTFTDPNSTTGYLVPTYELTEAGYRPDRFFGALAYSGSHPAAVDAVLRGAADAAVTWTSGVGDESRGFSRGNLRRMVKQGALSMSDIRIVWQSQIIVEGPWVVRQDLPVEAKDGYEKLLVQLPRQNKACLEAMVGGRTIGFEPVTQDYYQTIIDIRRQLNGQG